jgi:hypothetical protein
MAEFKSFTGVSDAALAIQDFLMDRTAELPEDVRTKLRALVGPTTSPVDAVVRGAELMYARRSELPPEAQELAAGLALIAQQYNFHGLAVEDRGSKIALAMLREAGVAAPTGITYPDPEDDPDADSQYVPAPEPDEDAPLQLTAEEQVPTSNVKIEHSNGLDVGDGRDPEPTPVEGAQRPRTRRKRTNTS